MVILSTTTDDHLGNLSVIPGMNFLSLAPAGSNEAISIFEPGKNPDFPYWDDILGNLAPGSEPLPASPLFHSAEPQTPGTTLRQGDDTLGLLFTDSFDKKQEFGSQSSIHEQSQVRNDVTMTNITYLWHFKHSNYLFVWQFPLCLVAGRSQAAIKFSISSS